MPKLVSDFSKALAHLRENGPTAVVDVMRAVKLDVGNVGTRTALIYNLRRSPEVVLVRGKSTSLGGVWKAVASRDKESEEAKR